jgi:predicted nuclease with TOPRIM domain
MPTTDILRAHFNTIRQEMAEIEAESAPLRAQMEQLRQQIQPLQARFDELLAKVIEIERPHLGELSNELSRCAKAMGGRSIDTAAAQRAG